MARILMVIAPQRFRDEEVFQPLDEFLKAGHRVELASTQPGICTGTRGGSIEVGLALKDVNLTAYDALVFAGGGGTTLLFDDVNARELARKAAVQNKILAAICLAPVILARAGVLKGKKATVSGQKAAEIESLGAIYTGPGVTVDGNLITANAPKASQIFAQKICEELALLSHS